MSLRVLVCGGRMFGRLPDNPTDEDRARAKAERERLFSFLDRAWRGGRIAVIIHGGARGADSLAGEWAKLRGVPCEVFPADWTKYGNRAGPVRNQEMLDRGKPDVVCHTEGGNGTRDMVRRSMTAGVKVVEVK